MKTSDIGRIRIEYDTPYVLAREYGAATLRSGLIGLSTPIFDQLAAERFSRDSH